jgi:hypothetical protein
MGLISGEKLVDSRRGSGHRYYQKLSSFPDNPFKKIADASALHGDFPVTFQNFEKGSH